MQQIHFYEFSFELGVDGFRIDSTAYLFERDVNREGFYDDAPRSYLCNDPEEACYLIPQNYTFDLNDSFDMIYEWRDVTDEYSNPIR